MSGADQTPGPPEGEGRPKVGYLLKKFPRLSETFVLGELLAQERLGQQLHIFSRRTPDDEPRHPELAQLRAAVEVLPSVRAIDPWRELFADTDGSDQLLEHIRGAYLGVQALRLERLPALMAEAIYLRRRCRELSIGHLHVHFATEAAITAMILRTLGGPSFSVTAHAKDIYRSTVDFRLLGCIAREAEFVVTVCDANVAHLRARLDPAVHGQLRRLYNGIDLERFEVPRRPVPGRILSVGRMVEKKGFDVLVEALAILRARGVEFSAVLAGDGDQRDAVQALIDARGLGGRVELPGALDQDRVRGLMSEAELFCAPCLIGADGNRDALPTVLLEAQAAGVPIVSTPVTGIPEILDEGRAGRLVPCGDARSTALALEELLKARSDREQLARAGRARAAQLFDTRINSQTLHGWFGRCLELGGAREPLPGAGDPKGASSCASPI